MRLKEIKPGMVIHCKTKEDLKKLSDVGISSCFGKRIDEYMRPACFVIIRDNNGADWTISIEEALEYGEITEFSDLIIPELSAEEVLQICSEICDAGPCEKCPMGKGNCFSDSYTDKKKVLEICRQWKADHDKKEPEIETVDICRIIEIQPDGSKRCVHEEDLASGSTDAEIKILVEAELKHYCMEHDGEYIAVHEVVSRVKAVK